MYSPRIRWSLTRAVGRLSIGGPPASLTLTTLFLLLFDSESQVPIQSESSEKTFSLHQDRYRVVSLSEHPKTPNTQKNTEHPKTPNTQKHRTPKNTAPVHLPPKFNWPSPPSPASTS
ncbi:hypothetical protein PGTUg99_012412 [Puccinia graminis f. sp. tritici]|uniref:Uncharacterized protein n=1 Tax=Puccinia graminis f. sp. tritici TaxID=56615 RepID=A0A5B0R9A9_PUCGR|nr:hypothetical protein PGTUg99_012412 [Puccinia graminis f. sp. tritici]